MSRRILPEHFKLDGTPKKGFNSTKEANKERIRSGKRNVYFCDFCQKYHVGG